MKADRFEDSIRRKLDSIRPEFAESDWTRMQTTLRQAGMVPGTPVVKPFLGTTAAKLAAAGMAGTVLFLTTTIWQHYELKRLHQTLQSVNQNVARAATPQPSAAPESLASTGPSPAAADRVSRVVDTVYINRYIAVPQGRADEPTQPAPDRPDQRRTNETLAQSREPARPATAPDATNNATVPNSSTESGTTPTSTDAAATTTRPVERPSDRVASARVAPGSAATTTRPRAGRQKGTRTEREAAFSYEPTGSVANGSRGGRTTRNGADEGLIPDKRAGGAVSNEAVNATPDASRPLVVLEPASSLPMRFDTVYWDALLAQRARRMRPTRTTLTGEKSPVGRRIEPLVVQFRAGATGESNFRLWSAGVFAEVLAGRHWTLSAGLQHVNFTNSTFLTDEDFDEHTKQNFRRKYARGLDPRIEILNISTKTTRIQVPLAVGYRLLLTPTLSLVPSIGTNLNLQNVEDITFYHRLPYRGFETVNFYIRRPVSLFDNVTFSPTLQWAQKHWGWQAGPIITVPFQPAPTISNPLGNQSVTASLRVRLFYQF